MNTLPVGEVRPNIPAILEIKIKMAIVRIHGANLFHLGPISSLTVPFTQLTNISHKRTIPFGSFKGSRFLNKDPNIGSIMHKIRMMIKEDLKLLDVS